MNKVLFFDFFGVVSSEVAPFWFRKHFDEETAKRVKEEICSKVDNGDISELEGFKEISKITNVDPNKIREEWFEMVHINYELVDKIMELKKDHKVYLLSNASRSFLQVILDKYDLHKLYDKEYISSDMHLIKPHVDYFEYVLKDLSIFGKDCIFIDDNIVNVEGAIKANINGIQFIDNKKLFEEIRSK